MKRLSLILSLLFAVSFTCAAQSTNDSTITISGKVVDENGEPLINAAIQLLDSSSVIVQQTVTDYDGNYLIQNVNIDNMYSVAARYPGMKTSIAIDIPATKEEIINFNLEENKAIILDSPQPICTPMIYIDNPSPINRTIYSYQIEKLAH